MRLSQKLSGDWWFAPFAVATFYVATQIVTALKITTAVDSFNEWLGVPYGCFSGLWINIQQWMVIAVDATIIFIAVASVWIAVVAICVLATHLLLAILRHAKTLLFTRPSPATTIVQP